MDISVSCSPQFVKQLSLLEKAGGKGALAAKQAERIAGRLAKTAAQSQFLRSKQTKGGEKRLKNIEKYDLGAGYRLICRREGSDLFLEFVGTHDKSDHWLNRAKDTANTPPDNRLDFLIDEGKTNPDPPVTTAPASCLEEQDSYETQLMRKIDEKTLRRIFCGFFDHPRQENS